MALLLEYVYQENFLHSTIDVWIKLGNIKNTTNFYLPMENTKPRSLQGGRCDAFNNNTFRIENLEYREVELYS